MSKGRLIPTGPTTVIRIGTPTDVEDNALREQATNARVGGTADPASQHGEPVHISVPTNIRDRQRLDAAAQAQGQSRPEFLRNEIKHTVRDELRRKTRTGMRPIAMHALSQLTEDKRRTSMHTTLDPDSLTRVDALAHDAQVTRGAWLRWAATRTIKRDAQPRATAEEK